MKEVWGEVLSSSWAEFMNQQIDPKDKSRAGDLSSRNMEVSWIQCFHSFTQKTSIKTQLNKLV